MLISQGRTDLFRHREERSDAAIQRSLIGLTFRIACASWSTKVKLGYFRKNQNKRQYAYLLTPAGLEEKTRNALAFLKHNGV